MQVRLSDRHILGAFFEGVITERGFTTRQVISAPKPYFCGAAVAYSLRGVLYGVSLRHNGRKGGYLAVTEREHTF
jgi:hypothetical protein